MTKTRSEQESRNEKTSKHKSQIIKIRDWLGFFFTVAGVFLSLSGTVHIDIQVQYNIVIEVYNDSSKEERTQWNSEDFLLNLKDGTDTMRTNNADKQKYPIEWVYTNMAEYPQDTPKRKKNTIAHKKLQ